MSSALPRYFDPARLAAQDTRLEGYLSTADMPRLDAMLAIHERARVAVSMHVYRNKAAELVIDGEGDATLTMTCQRCMEPVNVAVRATFALGVVDSEDRFKSLAADLDPLLLAADSKVDLVSLVEDELILALPVIARHGDVEECGPRARHLIDDARGEPKTDSAKGTVKENPFAVLKTLKTGKPD